MFLQNRGKTSNYQKTIKGIKSMVEEGINVLGQITLTKHNIHNVFETILLAEELGMSSIGLQFICPTSKASESSMPSYEDWKTCLLYLTELKMNNSIPIPISFNTTNESVVPWEMYLPLKEAGKLEMLYEVWGIDYQNFEISNSISCTAGVHSCAIAANGDVFGCEMLFGYNHLRAGNVLNEPFFDIWNREFRKVELLSKDKLKREYGFDKKHWPDMAGWPNTIDTYYR